MVVMYMRKSISPSDDALFIMLRMPLRADSGLFERSYVCDDALFIMLRMPLRADSGLFERSYVLS